MTESKTYQHISLFMSITVPVVQTAIFLLSGGLRVGLTLEKMDSKMTLLDYRVGQIERRMNK